LEFLIAVFMIEHSSGMSNALRDTTICFSGDAGAWRTYVLFFFSVASLLSVMVMMLFPSIVVQEFDRQLAI